MEAFMTKDGHLYGIEQRLGRLLLETINEQRGRNPLQWCIQLWGQSSGL